MKELIRKIRRRYIKGSKKLPKYYKISEFVIPNKKMLDFGCWQGSLSKILIEEKQAKVVGCDLMKKCSFKNKNFKYKQVSVKNQKIPKNETYDYIIFADVLEHLKDPKKILEESFKQTQSCIISIPNLDFFLYRLFPSLEEPPTKLTPHLHHWTLKKFRNFLPKNLEIVKVTYCTDFPEFRWANHFPFKNKSFFNQTLIMEIKKNEKRS